ncbi:MAG: hypothetical protein Q9175_003649 [Cornicularia normoerica]
MSPTLSSLLGLIALIPQVFSTSIPANPAAGLTNIISVDTAAGPLPPAPPGWYNIPGTSLSIRLTEPFGAIIRPETNAPNCLSAAQTNISDTIAAQGDVLIPRRNWQFVDHNVHLAASAPFRGLGTYGQLSSGLKGLLYLITRAGGPGARQLGWVLSDNEGGVGIVMRGDIGPYTKVVAARAGATAVSSMSSRTVAAM